MYLIECKDDASLCIVEDNEVICDESVQVGDVVKFIYEKKYYTGTIIQQSDNITILRKEAKTLKVRKPLNKTQDNDKNMNQQKTRIRKKRQMYSPHGSDSDSENLSNDSKQKKTIKKTKSLDKSKESKMSQQCVSKLIKESQCLMNKDSSENFSSSEEENSSPENKKHKDYSRNKQKDVDTLRHINTNSGKLQTHGTKDLSDKRLSDPDNLKQGFIHHLPSSSTKKPCRFPSQINNESMEKNDNKERDSSSTDFPDRQSFTDEDSNVIVTDYEETYDIVTAANQLCCRTNQLYGKDWPDEPMALLMNNIYCRKKILVSALGNSKAVTHIARRLMVGVFKQDKLVQCTLTGQSPRAQGKEKQTEEVECLDIQARNAIIDYALLMGSYKNWKLPERQVIERSMTQQLGRLKLEMKEARSREQQ